jgi:dTDP-4-amino-4,6-dideoxygalactose transaminase
VKHIACGEGGMITTNDEVLYKRLLKLRTHGIVKEDALYTNSIDFAVGSEQKTVNSEQKTVNGKQSTVSSEPLTAHRSPFTDNRSPLTVYPGWYMEMQELGYNYRLTDFQAALGSSQLNRADEGLQTRREIAHRYNIAFEGKDFILGQSGVIQGHAYHLYIIEVKDRLGLYNYLREHKIFSQIHYIPCHLMPYYRQQGWKEGDMPYAENYYKGCISLPMYPTLTLEHQDYVIHNIKSYYYAVK